MFFGVREVGVVDCASVSQEVECAGEGGFRQHRMAEHESTGCICLPTAFFLLLVMVVVVFLRVAVGGGYYALSKTSVLISFFYPCADGKKKPLN